MVDVLQRQVELVLVMFDRTAVLRPAIGQHAQQWDALLFEERQHSIIERLGSHQRVLPVIEFDESDACVSVDEGLLINAPDAL